MVLGLIKSMVGTLVFSATWSSGKAILIISEQLFADFCHDVFIRIIQLKEVCP